MANLNQWLNDYAVQLFRQNNGGTCEHCGSALGHIYTCKLLHNNGEILHLGPADTMNLPAVEPEIDRLSTHTNGDGSEPCYVVYVDREIVATFPVNDPKTRVAREYAEQFMQAVRATRG